MSSTRKLFVTTDTALDTGNAAEQDPSLVSDGGFAILNRDDLGSGSVDLTAADGAPDKMTLVRGGDIPQIEHIEKSKINSVQIQDFRAEVQQVEAVGFDGDAGDLTLVDGEPATVKVTRLEKGYEPFPRVSATAVKKTSDLPYDLAAKIAEEFRKQEVDNVFGSDTRKFVLVDVLSDVATTETQDGGASGLTATVVQGSKRVTLSGTPATPSVGETIRIGSATDDAFPVYELAAIDGDVLVLDRPYVGESASGVAIGDGPAPADGDAVGLKLTAIASEGGDPAVSFKTSLDDSIENDNITRIADPQTGSGLNAQLKNLEEFSWGTRGYYYTNYFPQTPESNVAAGTDYDILTLIYENDNDDAVVSQHEFREIHIAYPQGNVTLATLQAFFGF